MKKLVLVAIGAAFFACTPKEKPMDEVPAIVLDNMDTTVNPADDFFEFVNGNWIKKLKSQVIRVDGEVSMNFVSTATMWYWTCLQKLPKVENMMKEVTRRRQLISLA